MKKHLPLDTALSFDPYYGEPEDHLGLLDDAMLEGRGLDMVRRTFPGGHDWGVWRRCAHDFLPRLFRDGE